MADKSTRGKRYTEEFRLQAAKLIVEGGYTYHQSLPTTGRQRLGPALLGQGLPGLGHLPAKGQVVPLAEELKAARRELVQLRLENEKLKKAAAYFAKESL